MHRLKGVVETVIPSERCGNHLRMPVNLDGRILCEPDPRNEISKLILRKSLQTSALFFERLMEGMNFRPNARLLTGFSSLSCRRSPDQYVSVCATSNASKWHSEFAEPIANWGIHIRSRDRPCVFRG